MREQATHLNAVQLSEQLRFLDKTTNLFGEVTIGEEVLAFGKIPLTRVTPDEARLLSFKFTRTLASMEAALLNPGYEEIQRDITHYAGLHGSEIGAETKARFAYNSFRILLDGKVTTDCMVSDQALHAALNTRLLQDLKSPKDNEFRLQALNLVGNIGNNTDRLRRIFQQDPSIITQIAEATLLESIDDDSTICEARIKALINLCMQGFQFPEDIRQQIFAVVQG